MKIMKIEYLFVTDLVLEILLLGYLSIWSYNVGCNGDRER